MSFLAKLYFEELMDDDALIVLECSYEFNVATDRRGQRTEHLTGGRISLMIESSQKVDFLEWMKSGENKDGKIIFFKRDMMASDRKIVFHRADCIHYAEEFVADGKLPMKTRIIIAPFIITVDDTMFQTWHE